MKNSKMLLSHPEHSQTPRNDMQILSVRCFAVVVVACEEFRSYLFGRVRSQTSWDDSLVESYSCPAGPRRKRMLLRIQGYDFNVKYKPGTEMPFARQISRPNPLPSEESLDLRKLVQFLDEKFNALKQDTLSNPELQLYSGWPKNITKLQCWVSAGPTGMNRLLKTIWSSREKEWLFQNHKEMTS